MPSELNGRSAGPDERERLERFLAWRRTVRKDPQAPEQEVARGRLLPYVAAVAWLGLAILTGAAITTVAAGRGTRPRVTTAVQPGLITRPVEPTFSTPEQRILSAEPASTPSLMPAARPARVPTLTTAPTRTGATAHVRSMTKEPALVTAAVGKLKRWVGPEVRAGKAVIRWVKSQPAASHTSPEPDRPQAR